MERGGLTCDDSSLHGCSLLPVRIKVACAESAKQGILELQHSPTLPQAKLELPGFLLEDLVRFTEVWVLLAVGVPNLENLFNLSPDPFAGPIFWNYGYLPQTWEDHFRQNGAAGFGFSGLGLCKTSTREDPLQGHSR